MRRLLAPSRVVPLGVTALLAGFLPLTAAHAATPDYLADPDFRALAAASVFTQGQTYVGASVHQTAINRDKANDFEVTANIEVGFNQSRAEYNTSMVYEYSGGDITPMPRAVAGGYAQGLDALAARDTWLRLTQDTSIATATSLPPVRSTNRDVMKFGYNTVWGDYESLNRAYLSTEGRRALKMLGVPKARYTIGYGFEDGYSASNREVVLEASKSISPAFVLAALSNGALDGYITIDDVTAAPGPDGATIFTVAATDRAEDLPIDYVFSVNADGIVTEVFLTAETDDFAAETTVTLVGWGSDHAPIAQPNLDSVTVDRRAFRETVDYVYAAGDLKRTTETLANLVNDTARVAGVPVNTAMIQRAARLSVNPYQYDTRDTSRGVTVTMLDHPRGLTCSVQALTRQGAKQAVMRCTTPVQ